MYSYIRYHAHEVIDLLPMMGKHIIRLIFLESITIFYEEFESRYIPIGLANIYVMWLQDKHRLDDFFFLGL